MVLVTFEVVLKPDCMDGYLEMAAALRDELAQAEGFIRSERFFSMSTERKLLSLSVWESEEAVRAWREQTAHRSSQRRGREALFESYRITVSSPVRTYTESDRDAAPDDSNRFFRL